MSDIRDNLTLKTRWVMRRNAILGSATFQRWASRTPIMRGVARRRAAAQFDLIAGFVYSQILSAFVQSGLVTFLRDDLRSVAEIATFTKLETHAVERLMKAGEALSLSESPQPGLWTLGEEGAPLSANDGAMAMILHHDLLYRDLSAPIALLAKGRREETQLSGFWTYTSKRAAAAEPMGPDYSALMAATQPMVSQQIIDAYDFSAHTRMLDIGGGSGAFVSAVLASAPRLEFGILDLPDVILKAELRIASSHPAKEIRFHSGSFKNDAIPSGYDLITLSRILHDHDDDVAEALLANIQRALPPGGRLLIVEPMADSPHAKHMGGAYFGFYLWAMNSGRPRSAREITTMLKNAGFAHVKKVKTALPIITSALVATR